jgi:hypothetical protein
MKRAGLKNTKCNSSGLFCSLPTSGVQLQCLLLTVVIDINTQLLWFAAARKIKRGCMLIFLLKFDPTMQVNSYTESSEANFRPYLQQNDEAA